MQMDLYVTREVGRSAEAVFDYLSDASNNPDWQEGMRRCDWTTPPPVTIGSAAGFLPGSIGGTRFEVTDYQPGRRMTVSTIESTFPITVEPSMHPLGEERCRWRL